MHRRDRLWSWALASLIRCYFKTCRIEIYGGEVEAGILSREGRLLVAGWHRGMIVNAYHFRDRQAGLMVSSSRDGDLIAAVMRHLNFYNPRGSSTRGGTAALDELVDYVRQGHPGGLSTDGPKGPPYVSKPGIIKLAARSQAPLLPYACDAWPCYEFNSWDRTFLPLPLSRIAVLYDREPLYVEEGLGREDYARLLTELDGRLNRLSYQARYHVRQYLPGRDPRDLPLPEDPLAYLPRRQVAPR